MQGLYALVSQSVKLNNSFPLEHRDDWPVKMAAGYLHTCYIYNIYCQKEFVLVY